MTPGKVINIPAEEKHWHGAAPDSWFSHLAIEVAGEEIFVTTKVAAEHKDYKSAIFYSSCVGNNVWTKGWNLFRKDTGCYNNKRVVREALKHAKSQKNDVL